MVELLYKDENYKIIGISIDIHSQLGYEFLEIICKDAMEYEFRQLGIILPQKF